MAKKYMVLAGQGSMDITALRRTVACSQTTKSLSNATLLLLPGTKSRTVKLLFHQQTK